MSNIGWGELQPRLAEDQAGGLPGGPHQRPRAGGSADADGEELVAGAAERRRIRRPMPAGRKRRPGVMPHASHLPTPAHNGIGKWESQVWAQTRYHQWASWGQLLDALGPGRCYRHRPGFYLRRGPAALGTASETLLASSETPSL